jgi:hypothetical protein
MSCSWNKPGSPDCEHVWRWGGAMILTAPPKRHVECIKCGERQCQTERVVSATKEQVWVS